MYHISQNIKAKRFAKKDFVVACFIKAAKAYSVSEYNMYMSQLESHDQLASSYILEMDPSRWAMSHFPVRRYSIMTTNISESMNAVLKDARCKPIVPLIEHIRDLLQRWFFERRNEAEKMSSPVTNWLESQLKTTHKESIRLQIYPVNMREFRVVGPGEDDTVSLHTMTCTCRKFDLDRYPCVHALAACRDRNISYYTMCSIHYTTKTLMASYAESIYPVGDVQRWDIPPSITHHVVLPPNVVSRSAGRPKKNRIPSLGEDHIQRKCSRCNGIGHNRQTCKNPIPTAARSKVA